MVWEKIVVLEVKFGQFVFVEEVKILEVVIEVKVELVCVVMLIKVFVMYFFVSYLVFFVLNIILDVEFGVKVYVVNCVSCYGVIGNGDGFVGKILDLVLIVFIDKDCVCYCSIFVLY